MAISALKVTPSKLKNKATEFASEAKEVQNITDNMFEIIKQLTGAVWSGSAATVYTGRFNKLDNDCKKMYKMIKEFSDDLKEIAGEYETAEKANEAAGRALKTNVIS